MRNFDKSILIFCVFEVFSFHAAELNSKSPAAAARRGVRRAPRRVPPRGFATLLYSANSTRDSRTVGGVRVGTNSLELLRIGGGGDLMFLDLVFLVFFVDSGFDLG